MTVSKTTAELVYASPSEIRAARLAAGLTQRQAAALICYSRRAWQEWEGGRRRMRQITLAVFIAAVR